LQKKGLNVKILEVANEPGGRMRSDFYSGFILDKGFHLFLNGLPEPKKVLDIDSLKLKTIYPGLLIKYGSGFNIVSNPLKKTFDLISMSIGENSTFWDKFKMGKLFNHIQNLSFEEIFEICETRIHAIVTFLGLLELINLQQMTIIKGEGLNQFWIEENHEIEESNDSKNQSDENIVLESDEEIPTIES
jgi:hypothetical protein